MKNLMKNKKRLMTCRFVGGPSDGGTFKVREDKLPDVKTVTNLKTGSRDVYALVNHENEALYAHQGSIER